MIVVGGRGLGWGVRWRRARGVGVEGWVGGIASASASAACEGGGRDVGESWVAPLVDAAAVQDRVDTTVAAAAEAGMTDAETVADMTTALASDTALRSARELDTVEAQAAAALALARCLGIGAAAASAVEAPELAARLGRSLCHLGGCKPSTGSHGATDPSAVAVW